MKANTAIYAWSQSALGTSAESHIHIPIHVHKQLTGAVGGVGTVFAVLKSL